MLNQLYSRQPDDDEIKQILNCFGLKNMDDKRYIDFNFMTYFETINKIYNICNILMEIYLPCKWYYFDKLTNKKCITILRQLCKLYNKKLLLTFIVIDKCKIPSFHIFDENEKNIKIEKNKTIVF
tara:strand:+ start:1371 stop:1745 length:375 start_codon:yes stop_codon:yes gene_type:complete